jgi:predicted nucleotidyltransferase
MISDKKVENIIKTSQTKNNISKEKQLFNFIKSLAYENNCYYRVYGSVFNNHYFPEKSDIDIVFYCNEPEIVLHKLKGRIQYTKISKHTYSILHRKKDICYKIKFDYKNIPVSILLFPIKDLDVLENKIKNTSIVNWVFSYFLYLLKYLYYELQIMPKWLYKNIKNLIYYNILVDTYDLKIEPFTL